MTSAGVDSNVHVNILVEQTITSTGRMIDEIPKWWPSKMRSAPSAFQACVHNSLSLKVSQLKGAIVTCNKLLQAAIAQDQELTSKNYMIFLRDSLEGSAGRAHALLRTFEKDQGTSYELVEDARASAQGDTIKQRMTARCFQWGIKKREVLSTEWKDDLQDATRMLEEACADEEVQTPRDTSGISWRPGQLRRG